MTTVVHVRKSHYDIYIGRANGNLPQSKWANPWVIGKDGAREEVIARYEEWIRTQPDLMAALPELKDKVLGCWCDKGLPCHGHALIKLMREAGIENVTDSPSIPLAPQPKLAILNPLPDSDILPVFSTHYGFGQGGILTIEESGKTEEGNPVSVIDIAKDHGFKQLTIVDERIDGFLEAYKHTHKLGIQLIFGVKLTICADSSVKDDASLKTESKIIVCVRDTEGYSALIRLYNRAWTTNFYHQGRLSWADLKELWNPHLVLALPFFSSFLFKNTMTFGSVVPDFPVPNDQIWCFKEVDSRLPFASLVEGAVDEFVTKTGAKTQKVKTIYYTKPEDFEVYQVFRAINEHGTYSSPGVNHFASNQFNLMAWIDLIKKEQS